MNIYTNNFISSKLIIIIIIVVAHSSTQLQTTIMTTPAASELVPVFHRLTEIYTTSGEERLETEREHQRQNVKLHAPNNNHAHKSRVPSIDHRYERILECFVDSYHCHPDFYVRAPGRVNLIGEHIDYCGYSVAPMAIDRDVIIAVGVQPIISGEQPEISIMNMNAKYPSRKFSSTAEFFTIDREATPPASKNPEETAISHSLYHWTDYIQCGFKGVFEELYSKGYNNILRVQSDECSSSSSSEVLESPSSNPLSPTSSEAYAPSSNRLQSTEVEEDIIDYACHSLRLLVDGNIPLASGLSSSSALVCASALGATFAHSFITQLGKNDLVEISAKCERFVGTAGGAMDQAISFLSTAGSAQRIDFNPLHNTPVPLPADAVFVVANSLVDSEKAVAASRQFNLRVLECRLAALLLAMHFQIPVNLGSSSTPLPKDNPNSDLKPLSSLTLKQVQESSNKSLPEMVEFVRTSKVLREDAYTIEELENLVPNLQTAFNFNKNFSKVFEQRPSFDLYKRALHVYSEAHRVVEFTESSIHKRATVESLGRLMNESHESCSKLYECSCDELDTLVEIFRKAGAKGCRLTGAGWGGCVVAIFEKQSHNESAIEHAIDQVKSQYYIEYRNMNPNDERIKTGIFTSKPSSGAAVYVPMAEGADGTCCALHDQLFPATRTTRKLRTIPYNMIIMAGIGLVAGVAVAILKAYKQHRMAAAVNVSVAAGTGAALTL